MRESITKGNNGSEQLPKGSKEASQFNEGSAAGHKRDAEAIRHSGHSANDDSLPQVRKEIKGQVSLAV